MDLKSWRNLYRLSQFKLAKLAKVSLQTLYNIESKRVQPQKSTFDKLKRAIKLVETERKASPQSDQVAPEERAVITIEKVSAPVLSVPIDLSNLDLELIQRVLRLDAAQKEALLGRIG